MFHCASMANNSSKDAKTVAPCFRSAVNSDNKRLFSTDIVFAVSVFLCLICIIGILGAIGIIGIIILSILAIYKTLNRKKRTARAS